MFDYCTKFGFFHFAKNINVIRFNRFYRNETEMNDEFRSKFNSNQLRDAICQKIM